MPKLCVYRHVDGVTWRGYVIADDGSLLYCSVGYDNIHDAGDDAGRWCGDNGIEWESDDDGYS